MVEKKVIVLGGYYGALSVSKALSMESIQVILIPSDLKDHACHSRFISKRIIIPNPMDNGEELLTLLMDMNEEWEGALLIPTLDEYIIFISQHRSELKKKYLFTVQDWTITSGIMNKALLYSQAKEIGVPIPRFFLPDSIEFLHERRNEFFYPCILKPYESHKFDVCYGCKVLMVHNFDELLNLYQDTCKKNIKVMISEIIPGDDTSIYSYRSYIDSRGDTLAEICTQKLRQYPNGFGQGSVVRTIPLIPEVRDLAQKLLKNLSYYGESSAEFRLDFRDNQYKLMEINIRPVVTEWLFVEAGANFPYMTYLDLVENIRRSSTACQQEIVWIHNHWEIANLITYLKSGNLSLKKFFAAYGKKKVFIIPFFDDPIHYLIEISLNFKKILKRALKKDDL